MRLFKLLANWRWAEKITMREAAKEIGISAPTLCRVEKGEKMDGKTLSKILSWMMSEVE